MFKEARTSCVRAARARLLQLVLPLMLLAGCSQTEQVWRTAESRILFKPELVDVFDADANGSPEQFLVRYTPNRWSGERPEYFLSIPAGASGRPVAPFAFDATALDRRIAYQVPEPQAQAVHAAMPREFTLIEPAAPAAAADPPGGSWQEGMVYWSSWNSGPRDDAVTVLAYVPAGLPRRDPRVTAPPAPAGTIFLVVPWQIDLPDDAVRQRRATAAALTPVAAVVDAIGLVWEPVVKLWMIGTHAAGSAFDKEGTRRGR